MAHFSKELNNMLFSEVIAVVYNTTDDSDMSDIQGVIDSTMIAKFYVRNCDNLLYEFEDQSCLLTNENLTFVKAVDMIDIDLEFDKDDI
jgi:hypothetical protein